MDPQQMMMLQALQQGQVQSPQDQTNMLPQMQQQQQQMLNNPFGPQDAALGQAGMQPNMYGPLSMAPPMAAPPTSPY